MNAKVTMNILANHNPPHSPCLLDRLAQLRKSGNKKELEALQAEMTSALTAELVDAVGLSIQPWDTPHVEKASFPYQVDKQARKFSPIAQAQLVQNIRSVSAILVNPTIAAAILMGVETRLDPTANPLPQDLGNPEFRRFYDGLRNASRQTSHYTYSGTLVSVGWGSGDQVNVRRDTLPAGPRTASGRMASSVTAQMVRDVTAPPAGG